MSAGSAIPLTLALSLRIVDFFGDVHHIGGDAAAAHQLFKPYAAAAAALADVSQFEHLCPALQALGEVAKVGSTTFSILLGGIAPCV